MTTLRSLACASCLLALGTAAAARPASPQDEPATAVVVTKTRLMRVGGDVVGATVVTPKNEPLGKVEDLVIHPRGDIAFAELSGAASTRAGTYRYPVPWRAFGRNEASQLVLATAPADFAKYPRYEKADLTKMDWWVDAERAYAKIISDKATPVESAASLAPAKALYLASDLRARSIENPDGQKVATVHEIVMDPNVGRIAYVVLAAGGSGTGGGERLIAVPWESLKSMPDKSNPKLERLTLATTAEQLAKAPEFQATSEGWTKASDLEYVRGVYEFYTLPPYCGPGETPKK